MSKTIYDPISEALQLEPIDFEFDICYTESRKGIKPIVMTDEVKRKIAAKTSKPIDIHNTRYTSIISACESLNTTRHEINKMIKDGYAEYV